MVDQAEAFFDVNLFCPDLFSESIPSFGSLEPSTETRLSRLFEENYPNCGRLEKITRCGEIGINSANFRIKTNESSYILKCVSKSFDEVKPTVDLAVWLHRQGVAVPSIYANNIEQLITRGSNDVFYLMEEVVGSFVSGEHEDTAKIRELFESLLALSSSLTYPPANIPLLPLLSADDYAVLQDFERKLDFAADLLGVEAAKCLVRRWSEIRNLVVEHIADLGNNPLRTGLMHIDLHPHNIMLSKLERRAVALDLDSFRICAPEVAMGFGLFKILRQTGTKACSISQLRSVKEELMSFDHALSATRYLLLARTEVLRRIIIILRLSLQGDKTWCHVLPVHLRGLNEIEVLL